VNFSGKALDERGNSISGTTAPMFAVLTLVNERFYEKVIKVKADVAAYLN